MKKQNLKNYIDQATRNITDDRAATQSLLVGLMKYMSTAEEKHRDFGLIAAKYLETLQRSNEQLVKLATILQKSQSKDESISEEDKKELFDLISESDNQENKK